MISITVVLLIRLVPYAVVTVLAARKGFKWLVVYGVFLILAALINAALDPSPEQRGFIASIGSIFLLMHALNLRARKRGRS